MSPAFSVESEAENEIPRGAARKSVLEFWVICATVTMATHDTR
jgi:hypothetical protein